MSEILEKFQKLKISNFIELALIVPKSYEDLRLHSNITDQTSILIDATVNTVVRAKNTLQVTFFAHNLDEYLQGVLFHPKPYMMHQFIKNDRGYFYGQLLNRGGAYTISMPKKVTNIGSIVPKYKSSMRSDFLYKFIKEHLNLETLLKEGIKEDVAKTLLELHFPSQMPPKELSSKTTYALKYAEIFNHLQSLSQKRKYFPAIMSSHQDYKTWLKTLPFELTKDQLAAIEDIKDDFSKNVAAKRVVVGDVGSGKTMVILASAYMNYPSKSVLMAPTTILANQLYEEARAFLPFMSIALVTNKTKAINLDEFDFLIGTHALLYRALPAASLIMIDEQHRFGTMQRNKLDKLTNDQNQRAHFLQFSATPIPRTQAMIQSSYIDISLIKSTPFKKDISTQIIRKNDFKNLIAHIKLELSKNNQVLLVYPLVEQSDAFEYQSISEARGFWEKNFEDVYVTYGSDKQKEQVLLSFRDSGKILIATTVIEVGISLPRLSTIVIVGAERLGLSTLHQLRGRVSRTGLKGYCYLYTNQENSSRLERFCTTSSGFDIAELDLEFRKSGDLLKGVNQSGKEFIWFDMSSDISIIEDVKRDKNE